MQAKDCSNHGGAELVDLNTVTSIHGGTKSGSCYTSSASSSPAYMQLQVGPATYDIHEIQWTEKTPTNAAIYIGSSNVTAALSKAFSFPDVLERLIKTNISSTSKGLKVARPVGSGHASYVYIIPPSSSPTTFCNVKLCVLRRDFFSDGRPMTKYGALESIGYTVNRSRSIIARDFVLRGYPHEYSPASPDPRGYCTTNPGGREVVHDTGKDNRCQIVNGVQQLCVTSYEPGLDDCQGSCFWTNEHPCNKDPGHITGKFLNFLLIPFLKLF